MDSETEDYKNFEPIANGTIRSTFEPVTDEDAEENMPSGEFSNSSQQNFVPQRTSDVPSDAELNENEDELDEASGSQRTEWTDELVKLLLSSVEEIRPLVGKSGRYKSKKKMWLEITKRLEGKGKCFTVKQVSNKFFALERAYKATRDHNKKSGRDRRSCPYQQQLENLLAERHAVNPVHTLGSSETVELDEIDGTESSRNDDSEAEPSTSGTNKRKRKNEMIMELRSLRESNDDFHNKMLDIIETSEAKKVAIMEERNKLLKQFLNKL